MVKQLMGDSDVWISQKGCDIFPRQADSCWKHNCVSFHLPDSLLQTHVPRSCSDNSLATMTARANQQDNAWKPSNYCWHIQSFLIFSHWFWSLTPTMAPTWATLGTLWSFPSCFQQVGSFPECPKEAGQRQKLWHLFHLGKLKQCFPIFLWVEKILKCCFLFQFSTKTYWNSCLLKHSSPS